MSWECGSVLVESPPGLLMYILYYVFTSCRSSSLSTCAVAARRRPPRPVRSGGSTKAASIHICLDLLAVSIWSTLSDSRLHRGEDRWMGGEVRPPTIGGEKRKRSSSSRPPDGERQDRRLWEERRCGAPAQCGRGGRRPDRVWRSIYMWLFFEKKLRIFYVYSATLEAKFSHLSVVLVWNTKDFP